MIARHFKFLGFSLAMVFAAACGEGADSGSVDLPRLSQALSLATQEIAAVAAEDPRAAWRSDSRVVSAFALQQKDDPDADYFELKVQTRGGDAGYLLLSCGASACQIPEYSQEGLTLTERYVQATGRADLTIVRESAFASVALSQDPAADPQVLASIGQDGTAALRLSVPAVASADWRALTAALDHLPAVDAVDHGSVGQRGQALRKGQNRYRYLKHKLVDGNHTPSWDQPKNSRGYPVGCGNTAWAIVYGYWKQFKGKTRLFDGLDLTHRIYHNSCDSGTIYNAMWRINKLTDTSHGTSSGSKYGMTVPWKMPNGIKYAREKGYTGAKVERDRATEGVKFDRLEREVANDRPPVILINSKGSVPWGDHYVVIEGTRKRGRFGLDALYYKVNWGHGSSGRKWISSRKGNPRHSVWSAYYIRL